jgi:WD40 repeat protein
LLKFRTVIEAAPLQIYVACMVFSPTGSIIRSLFTASGPQPLPRLAKEEVEWDPVLLTIQGVGSVAALSPDGAMVASGGLCIWDTTTGALITDINDPYKHYYEKVAFSSDARVLIGVSRGGDVKAWNTATGQLLQHVTWHQEEPLQKATFSKNCDILVMLAKNNTVAAVNINTATLLPLDIEDSSDITAVDLSPDGTMLGSVSKESVVRLWDTSTGTLLREFLEERIDDYLVQFSSQGTIISTVYGNTISLWKLRTDDPPQRLQLIDKLGHPGPVSSLSSKELAFSPDDTLLAASDGDRAYLWNIVNGTLLWRIDTSIPRPMFSRHNRLLTSAGCKTPWGPSGGSLVRFWDLESGALVHSFDNTYNIHNMLLSQDGSIVASVSFDELRLWDMTVKSSSRNNSTYPDFYRLIVSPDGKVAISLHQNAFCISSIQTGQRIQVLPCGPAQPTVCQYSPSGAHLAISGENKDELALLDPQTLEVRFVLTGHEHPIGFAAFSPDSRLIATSAEMRFDLGPDEYHQYESVSSSEPDEDGNPPVVDGNFTAAKHYPNPASGADNRQREKKRTAAERTEEGRTIRLWDLSTGQLLHKLKGHTRGNINMAFSPDGKLLASGSHDTTIRLWNTTTGTMQMLLTVHTTAVRALCFSPNGRFLASGDDSSRVLLWNTTTREIVREISTEANPRRLAFSPDGRLLAALCLGSLHLFDTKSGNLVGSNSSILGGMTHGRDLVSWWPGGRSCTTGSPGHYELRWSGDGRIISTDMGAISLDYLAPSLASPEYLPAVGTFVDGNWLVRGTEKVLMLPPEHKAECAAVHGSTVVIGTQRRRMLVMKME